MRGATNVTLQTHHILRLPRKMTIQHLTEICGKQLKRNFQCTADPRTFREWSEHDPRPFPSVRNPPRNRGYFSRSGRAFCIEKYNISRSGYLSKFHQVLRLPRKVTLELHQVLRLPRKVTLELHQVLRLPRKVTLELHQVLRLPRKVTLDLHQLLRLPRKVTLDLHQLLRLPHRMTRRLDPRHIWNVISNARSNKCHPPNSPHTAPATQNDHPTSGRNLRKTAETSFPMRGRSDQDPITFRDRSETVSVSPQPATQQRLLFALRTSVLYWKIQHFALRLSFQISPSTAPTTKSDTSTSPSTAPTTQSDTSTSPSTAPATKSDTWTSPSTAPTTKSDTWTSPGRAFCIEKYNISRSGYLSKFHQVLRLPRKVALQLHQVLRLPRKVTLQLHQVLRLPRKVTLELHQVLRLPRKVTLELHQVLRLPRKVTLELHQVLRLPRKVTLELHQVLRLPRKVTLDLHQVLRLPRKVTLELNQVLRLPRKVTLDLSDLLRSDSTQRFY